MGKLTAPALVALAFVLLLASLSMVTWRQSRALEALAALDGIQRDVSLAEAEVAELGRRIQSLEGRTRVVSDAHERLGMRVPEDDEIVHLPGSVR